MKTSIQSLLVSHGEAILSACKDAVLITTLVLVMMLITEYVNVFTSGRWQRVLSGGRFRQYLLAAFLGATPGCLGAFAVFSLYSHGAISVGALVAAMVATSGDEAFVMLALFPLRALLLFGVLFVMGIVIGVLVDVLLAGARKSRPQPCGGLLELHEADAPGLSRSGELVEAWRRCTPERGIMAFWLVIFGFGLATGSIAADEELWIRWTLGMLGVAGLFIVAVASDHFLREHLWGHVVRTHAANIFVWTLGALLVVHVFFDSPHVKKFIEQGGSSRWLLLITACVVGLIPESGPHLVFVMLYRDGVVPFSILLANSVVQDGHGMLPVLAHSRRTFLLIKLVCFALGITTGAVGLMGGW